MATKFGVHDGKIRAKSIALRNEQGTDVLIFRFAGVPADGIVGTGTMAGFAGPGSICVDTTNANLYVNTGTKLSPVWKLVTRA